MSNELTITLNLNANGSGSISCTIEDFNAGQETRSVVTDISLLTELRMTYRNIDIRSSLSVPYIIINPPTRGQEDNDIGQLRVVLENFPAEYTGNTFGIIFQNESSLLVPLTLEYQWTFTYFSKMFNICPISIFFFQVPSNGFPRSYANALNYRYYDDQGDVEGIDLCNYELTEQGRVIRLTKPEIRTTSQLVRLIDSQRRYERGRI